MVIYLKLIRYLKPYIHHFIIAIVAMLILAATTAIYSYLVGPLLKFLFLGADSDNSRLFEFITIFAPGLREEPERMIYFLPIFILIVGLLKGISYAIQFYEMGYIGQKVIYDLRKELFERLTVQDISFFWSRSSGDLTSRITSDCEKVEQSVTYALSSSIRDTVQILVLIGLCFYLDYKLTIISFIALILAGIPLGLFGIKLKETTIEVHNRLGEIASFSSDYINGIQTLHLFNIRGYIRDKFISRLDRFFNIMKRSIFIRSIQSPVMELIGVIGICLTIIYARERIASGELRAENFISLFAAILMLYNPVKNVSRMNNFFTSGVAGAKRIFEIIESRPEIEGNSSGLGIEGFKDRIELISVSVKLGEREVLKDIDMVINKGKKIGIAGESGAGKSTLIMLITRLIKPDSGRILIDDIDIEKIRIQDIRNLFSVVSQEVILFNDTIYNNLLIGKPNASESEIIKSLKKANLYDFVMSLPEGLNTIIGERGIKLSGGERQRLSIARAFLKDAPIIILDEATSSLDSRNEAFIQDILNELMFQKTAIMISHRLSFLKGCDIIYFIDDNIVKEKGSFDELMSMGGKFYTLYNLQNDTGEKI